MPSALPSRWVPGPGGRLAVLDAAAAGPPRRAPVLLVPGYTGSKEDFGPLLPLLAARGHRAVAMDQRGQFESEGPDGAGAGAAYTPDALAPDLAAVRDRLGLGPAHLVGHSYGGLVARAAVLADPRGWLSCTLLDSGPAALSGPRRASTELLSTAARTVALPELWDAVTAYWAAQGHAPPPADAAAFQRERFTRGRAAAVVGMGQALLREPDRVSELSRVADAAGVPLAVVFGEDDDAWLPSAQRGMADELGCRAWSIPDAAHSPAVEQPEATAAALAEILALAEGPRHQEAALPPPTCARPCPDGDWTR